MKNNKKLPMKIDPGKTYTVSGPPPKQVLFFDEKGNEISRINVARRGNKTYTFIAPKECTAVKIEGWVRRYDSL